MLPTNISKGHLLEAIKKIDNEGIPNDAVSKYYDVVYNNKVYPPKLIVSYANLFANGKILDRNSFEGGVDTECFKLLEQNQFEIKLKKNQQIEEPKIWFVTQGSTFSSEKGMKFLFAPSKGNDGKSRFFWTNLLEVKKGDIIFNYSDGIKGVSIASSDGYNAINNDSTSQWSSEGFRVDIELTQLSPFIERNKLIVAKDDLNRALSSVRNKPFTQFGNINQGYLYEFTKEAGRVIRDIYGKDFGNPYLDNFFDQVEIIIPPTKSNISQRFDYRNFCEHSKNSNLYISDELTLRFISSLLTKPFVILTGLSGSGKTKLAQAFATWICESHEQYIILPIGADWTNREPILGYLNALVPNTYVKPENGALQLIINAINNPDKPYFLILDEMNLSHVERYFADFLSAMESKEVIFLHSGDEDFQGVPPSIALPNNLFIIGTVNVDETTYMFSPKVLDRANVIEFRVDENEMKTFLNGSTSLDLKKLESEGAHMASDFLAISNAHYDTSEIDITNDLLHFFKELKLVGAEFGYRTASEIIRFVAVTSDLDSNWTKEQIIDSAIMQKLLPKLHGSRRKLEATLKALAELCLIDKSLSIDALNPKKEFDFNDNSKIKFPISLEKTRRMNNGLINNNFTSYAEA